MTTEPPGDREQGAEARHRRPPVRALWEFTWHCDLRCAHCLVDAGPNELQELSTAEAMGLVDQIADLGVRAVTLSGGEPLLRRDWFDVCSRIRERGLICRLSTNGNLVDGAVVQKLASIGVQRVVMSIDGLQATHDAIRVAARPGRLSPFGKVMEALDLLAGSGVGASIITAVMRPNLTELPAIHRLLKERGIDQWTVQLAHATGRLAQGRGSDLLLAPEQLEELVAFLAGAARDPVLPPIVFNSIGYLSDEEPVIRPSGRSADYPFWRGCRCGVTSVGIEPDGGIKGCANQIGDPFVVGSVRRERLREIWDDLPRWHWLHPDPGQLGGTCAGCAFGRICGAGCTALAWASSGELYDNPYCLRAVRRARGEAR